MKIDPRLEEIVRPLNPGGPLGGHVEPRQVVLGRAVAEGLRSEQVAPGRLGAAELVEDDPELLVHLGLRVVDFEGRSEDPDGLLQLARGVENAGLEVQD